MTAESSRGKYSSFFDALAFILMMFGLWSVYVWLLDPIVYGLANIGLYVLLDELIRILIFVLPVWLYIRFVAQVEPLRYLKLNTNISKGIVWGSSVAVVFIVVHWLHITWLSGGEARVHLSSVRLEDWCSSLTIAPLAEEIAFRGFLLQKLSQVVSFWRANFITACLFVAIHFPGWILAGHAALLPDKAQDMAAILFVGLLSGYSLNRTGSLWSCFIIHATNNFVFLIFYAPAK